MRNQVEMLHSSARNNLTTELIVLALFIPRSFLLSFLVFVESKPMSANGLMATSGFACFAQHTSHFLWEKKRDQVIVTGLWNWAGSLLKTAVWAYNYDIALPGAWLS